MRPVITPRRGWVAALSEALLGPQLLVFALAFLLALAWFGIAALWLLLPFGLIVGLPRHMARARPGHDAPPRQLAEMARAIQQRPGATRRDSAAAPCVFLGIDDFAAVRARHGPEIPARLVTACLDQIDRALRNEDRLFDLGEGRFGALLATEGALDEDAAQRVAQRLGVAAETALWSILPGDAHRVTTTVTMIPPRAPPPIIETLAQALGTLGAPPATPPPRHESSPPARLRTRNRSRDDPMP